MLLPEIDPRAVVDVSARVWGGAVIREGATIGANTIVGKGAYIDTNVSVGKNCKIQNLAQIYSPAKLSSGVFVGPSVVLTNDKHPRAVTPEGAIKSSSEWDAVGVEVAEGASIGAGSICVAPLTIGKWAMIAAGSVVIKNVADFEIVGGNPARHLGWAGRSGHKLIQNGRNRFRCPTSGEIYKFSDGVGIHLGAESD